MLPAAGVVGLVLLSVVVCGGWAAVPPTEGVLVWRVNVERD
jgi:hypothetical protein